MDKLQTALHLRSQGRSLRAIGAVLGVSGTRVAQLLEKAAKPATWHDGLDPRTRNTILTEDGTIRSREDLAQAIRCGRINLDVPNLGVKSYLAACEWCDVEPIGVPKKRDRIAEARALLEGHGYRVHSPPIAEKSGARSGATSPGSHQ